MKHKINAVNSIAGDHRENHSDRSHGDRPHDETTDDGQLLDAYSHAVMNAVELVAPLVIRIEVTKKLQTERGRAKTPAVALDSSSVLMDWRSPTVMS